MAASLCPHLGYINCPIPGQKVYKDECAFSFDTPECETGLFICMRTFLGLGKQHVMRYHQKTGNAVFLHIKTLKKKVPQSPETEKAQPTKLAIGVEGGFPTGQILYEYEHEHAIVVLPQWVRIDLPDPELPDIVNISAASILTADSAAKLDDMSSLQTTWDGEQRRVSKYAENLLQLDNGIRVPPTGWKCSECDKTDNLWLNLTDGSILCGRKFFDGTGGNNHAVDHYQRTLYPLAVKLGTITPDGADIYSYDEDDMVLDPHLRQHLAHFGINIAHMQKTEKTMIELEIDLNQRAQEWDVIQESGRALTPLYGPGYTGIDNLGNSCYMNSVIQVLFAIPDFQIRYANQCATIFDNAPLDPTTDFTVQMAKFGHGLLSGDYSKPPPKDSAGGDRSVQNQTGVRPVMFRSLIGRGHAEFASKRQQDAQEFLLHLINLIQKSSRGGTDCCECLRHRVEERIECSSSGQVSYTERDDFMLALRIPTEAATNHDQVNVYLNRKAALEKEGKHMDANEPIVRLRIPFSACVEALLRTETVQDFYSSAIGAKTSVFKTTRLATFPDYLFVQLKKFTIGDDWVPKKLDVSVDMPDEIDLRALRGYGIQPGEIQLPQQPLDTTPEVSVNEAYVGQLVEMGFPPDACRRAVYSTNNSGVEEAMNWLMAHMDDPDFGAPFVPPQQKKSRLDESCVSADHVTMIMGMGFSKQQATNALQRTDNNLERAVDYIFSHAHELDQITPATTSATSGAGAKHRDGNERYRLLAFISHMGTSSMVGHYVCHVMREGQWVIYNDEKVAVSEQPPKDLGYLYLYQRQA